MFRLDRFWDDVVEQEIIGPDQAGRARARHAQAGGGLDTAILEVVALSAQQINQLLGVASEALGHQMAHVEYIDAPDLECLARLPRDIVERFGVLPSRNFSGDILFVIPPLAPHGIEDLKRSLRSADSNLEREFVIGLESDLREALRRFAGIPLPERFEALWTGHCPSVAPARPNQQLGPVATPRATYGIDFLTSDNFPQIKESPFCETDDHLIDTSGNSGPNTRPGRPTALGLADTGEFQEHHARAHGSHRMGESNLTKTDDEQNAITSDLGSKSSPPDSSSSTLIRVSTDTIPP